MKDSSTVLQKLQQSLKTEQEAFLVRHDKNRFYLTGFSSSEGVLLVMQKEVFLFLDGRYLALGEKYVKSKTLRLLSLDQILLQKTMKNSGLTKVYYDQDFSGFPWLAALRKSLSKAMFFPFYDRVEKLRTIKTAEELEKIKQACAFTDKVFAQTKKAIKSGMTEKDIQILLRSFALKEGLLELGFNPIVGIGAGASYPHYMLTSVQKLKKGDMILIDMGMDWQGYKSDMTRMLFLGKPPEKMAKLYEQVLAIQKNTIAKVQVGKTIGETITGFNAEMKQHGFSSKMLHGLGHGVGLDVHELPILRTTNNEKWQTDMVVAIEPGVYEPGKYGIRIEDTCHVSAKGTLPLTKSPKELKESII